MDPSGGPFFFFLKNFCGAQTHDALLSSLIYACKVSPLVWQGHDICLEKILFSIGRSGGRSEEGHLIPETPSAVNLSIQNTIVLSSFDQSFYLARHHSLFAPGISALIISFWQDSSSEEDDTSSSPSSSSKPGPAQQLRERKRKALAKKKAATEKRKAQRPLPPGLQTGWKCSFINTKGLNKLTRNRRNRKRKLTLNIAAYGPGVRRQTEVGWPAVFSTLEGLDLRIAMGVSLGYDRREKRQWTFHVFVFPELSAIPSQKLKCKTQT